MGVLHSTGETISIGGRSFRLEQWTRRIAYWSLGTLKRIVNDWVDSGIPSMPHIVTKAPLMISCADDGMRRIHPTRELGRYVELGPPYVKVGGVWTQPALGSPVRTGNLLQWTTANANLYAQMGGHFVKFGFLLKGGWIPEDYQIAVPVGLTGLTRSGSSILRDGVVVATLRKPHMEDVDNPLDVRPVDIQFTYMSGQWYVLMTLPDLSGMSKPLLDPTLTLQPDAADGDDVFITSDDPAVNKDGLDRIWVGDVGGANVNRTLIRFDLSSLPDDALVSSAVLSLYCNNDQSANARDFKVYRCRRVWVEDEATWNIWSAGNNWGAAGGFDPTDTEQTEIAVRNFTDAEALNEFKNWTLTAASKTDLDYGLENGGDATGWMVKADTETSDAYRFASSDHATAANRPMLSIGYTLPGGGLTSALSALSAMSGMNA